MVGRASQLPDSDGFPWHDIILMASSVPCYWQRYTQVSSLLLLWTMKQGVIYNTCLGHCLYSMCFVIGRLTKDQKVTDIIMARLGIA